MRKNSGKTFGKCLCLENNTGFTLVEMIIAIAVIAVLSAIAVPNLLTWRGNAELNRATRDVVSNLQRAKLTAVKRNTYCAVTFSATGYTVYVDSSRDLVKDAGEDVIATVSLSEYGGAVSMDTSQGGGDGLTFSSPTDSVAFAPNGFPKNSSGGFGAGSVFLRNNNNRTTSVVVSSAGNIRIP